MKVNGQFKYFLTKTGFKISFENITEILINKKTSFSSKLTNNRLKKSFDKLPKLKPGLYKNKDDYITITEFIIDFITEFY